MQSFVDKNVSHFYHASYANLLREDDLNGDSMLPFFASVIDDRQLTTVSCLKCINYQDQNLNLSKVEICHLCHLLSWEPCESNVYACRHFEKSFDFEMNNEHFVARKNVTLKNDERNYFFYKLVLRSPPSSLTNIGKDMESLQREAIVNLNSFLTGQFLKRDTHRHVHGTMSGSQIRMHLSRINDPLKKFNNDKGEIQLRNHARSLSILGREWVNEFIIKDQYYMIDLTNGRGESFIKLWCNSSDSKSCNFHQIISRSTIVKLNKYLVDNHQFKIDKCAREINTRISPQDECSNQWTERWFIKVNVRELCHQLCSILFRTRSSSNYSQHHRNNLAFGEMLKLFDWGIYSEEQHQIIQESIAKSELNKEHKVQCEESSQSKITLAPDGTTGITSNKKSKYNIEDYMPLLKAPRLDMYFDNSELTTFSILNCASLEFLCKNNEEYCLLKVTPYGIQDPPPDLIMEKEKARKRSRV